jgi:hypothetical protein
MVDFSNHVECAELRKEMTESAKAVYDSFVKVGKIPSMVSETDYDGLEILSKNGIIDINDFDKVCKKDHIFVVTFGDNTLSIIGIDNK